MTRYAHIARAVASRPWAILRNSVEWAAVMDVLTTRLAGDKFTDDEVRAKLAGSAPREAVRSAVAVADASDERVIDVIPIHGILMPRANIMMEFSGGTSVSQLSAAFRQSLDDDRVAAIVFDIDSPGGLVDGIPEFGEQVRAARGVKPIYGVSDTMAASAAYWIAAQVDELAVSPSGEVGSIGVFTAHDDLSKFYTEFGLERTFIQYGENKTDGNEFEPLGDHARERLQATIDYFGKMFDNAVAAGRDVSAATVREKFGQGDMFPAREALSLGMVDSIETLGQVIERAAAAIASPQRDRRALGGVQPIAVAVDVPATDEADADEAVAEATSDAEITDEARHELNALQDRIALRPYQRRHGRAAGG